MGKLVEPIIQNFILLMLHVLGRLGILQPDSCYCLDKHFFFLNRRKAVFGIISSYAFLLKSRV